MNDVDSSPAHLREFLAEADVPCPGCGYNLRGLPTAACPECNQALVLRVGLAEPRMRLYIAGMVGLAAGAGFSGLLLLYALTRTVLLDRGSGPFWNLFMVTTAVGTVVEGALLAWWLSRGARLRRMSRGTRGLLAGVAWVITLINLAAFVMLIR